MSELITVIVPVYEVEQYLNQCIESVVMQDDVNQEIILIDDGSTDECSEICDYWAEHDTRIIVIHKKNGGLSSARNFGLDIRSGAYITFIDSDDWIDENYIALLYDNLIKNNADICSCNYIIHKSESVDVYQYYKKEFVAGPEETLKKLYKHWEFPVCACMKMYSTHIWNQLRFPVGHNYEDVYTVFQVIDCANKIIHISNTPYHYNMRPNNITNSKFSLSRVDRADAWKQNYLFCRSKYPRVAPYARIAWLEQIPPLLSQFPIELTVAEANARKVLKKEIRDNLGFIITRMPLKKKYYQLKALLLY